jgi:hypothetical protein
MPAGFAMPQNPFGAGDGVPKWKIAGAIGDPKKADGDVMMTSVAGLATKWRKDVVWCGLNFSYVRPGGMARKGHQRAAPHARALRKSRHRVHFALRQSVS